MAKRQGLGSSSAEHVAKARERLEAAAGESENAIYQARRGNCDVALDRFRCAEYALGEASAHWHSGGPHSERDREKKNHALAAQYRATEALAACLRNQGLK